MTDLYEYQWAMTETALQSLFDAAVMPRQADRMPDALKAYVTDGVGILRIQGPIVPSKTYGEFYGLTSVERLSEELEALQASDEVGRILLFVDSPGGAVPGVSEFADQVKRSKKPVDAFVFGSATSAAYWAISGARRVYAADTAVLGGLGVIWAARKPADDSREAIFVSSQTPQKTDLVSDSGRASMQKAVDSVAQVFLEAVASNRGVTLEQVNADFGQGGILAAGDAVSAGMADEIITFEALCGKLRKKAARSTSGGSYFGAADTASKERNTMDIKLLQAEHPEVFEAAVSIGVKRERERVDAHLTLADASGDMENAIKAIKEGGEMNAAVMAHHQAVAIKAAQQNARVADNPPTGDVPTGGQSTDQGDPMADRVADYLAARFGAEMDDESEVVFHD
jgi:ClpP class serine protease